MQQIKMTASAKNPERVLDKVRECHFFLVQMAGYEGAADTEKFLYCLSAFMSAFRTIANRLYGVAENKLGIAVKHALKERLHDHPEIRFLIERTNVELHEDGVVVFQRFSVHPMDNPSRWMRDRFAARYVSRWGWREGRGMVISKQEGWRFAENPKNLIELCHDGLEAIETFIREILTTEPAA